MVNELAGVIEEMTSPNAPSSTGLCTFRHRRV